MYKKYVVNGEPLSSETLAEGAALLLNGIALGSSVKNISSSAQALGKMLKEDNVAEGRPHTVLCEEVSSKIGEVYRQSATFPGGTWPTVNGHLSIIQIKMDGSGKVLQNLNHKKEGRRWIMF